MLPDLETTFAQPLTVNHSAFASGFWQALDRQRLVTTQCSVCEALHFPPRAICHRCGSRSSRWTELSGRGKLYSRTRVHAAAGAFAALSPYSVGIVDLDDGPRLLVRLLPGASAAALDSTVQLVVLRHPDGPLLAADAASKSTAQR